MDKKSKQRPNGNKIRFRNYKKYPPHLVEAGKFRDKYLNFPDDTYLEMAKKANLFDLLVELADWEAQHTDL